MRRALFLFAAALLSCEDGPTQTFNASPNGAGDRWNDGTGAGSTDPANQGFNSDVGGATKQEICPGPQKKAKWAAMLAAPIIPPRLGANLDMAGSDKWEGITLDQAEQINCQSTNYDANDNYWGDNGEVFVAYRTSTRKITELSFTPGYTGAMDFTSRDGTTSYRIALSAQIKKGPKGGALNPMVITWDTDPATGTGVWANQITDALFATFMPALPAETNCLANGHCVIESFGDAGGLFIPALGIGFDVQSVTAAQPTPSTVAQVDEYLEKVLPFSQANPLLKLDAAGPLAKVTNLGPSKKTCNLQMGITYAELLGNCVNVSGNAGTDTAELNKLLGGLSHGDERFLFDLSGVDINFSSKALASDSVVKDKDVPTPADVSTRFDVDQSTLGAILNDSTANDVTQGKDFHGTGLVYAEFIRLSQAAINARLPASKRHALGAAACLTGNPATFEDGCTGLEGFVVPLDPARIADVNLKKLAVDPKVEVAAGNCDPAASVGITCPIVNGGGLKPGHQKVIICDDVARTKCTVTGDTFPTMFARLVKVLGHGTKGTLPTTMQDGRFFFQQWATAFFKYMIAENAGGTATASDVASSPMDPDALFFDSVGSGQFESAEYVDRRFVTATQVPTDVNITVDVIDGIFNDYEFSRDLLRGERSIYTAIRATATDPIGKDNALITSVFGSPILTANWTAHANATAWECATGAKSVVDCEGQGPPTDPGGTPLVDGLGQPLLTAYKGAFGGGVFKLGGTSKLSIKNTYPAIQSAMSSWPLTKASFGPTADFLVPWLPKQPGVGFPIAVSGTIDKFVSTYQLDFTGTTISANIDYDWVDPTNPGGPITLLAVESVDFLGDVFLCRDPLTSDLLHARMYSPVADILDWLASHPGVSAACGIVVRYSPYNNFPDYISSLTNGVRLGITQGGGFGRVVDATLFVPGQ